MFLSLSLMSLHINVHKNNNKLKEKESVKWVELPLIYTHLKRLLARVWFGIDDNGGCRVLATVVVC